MNRSVLTVVNESAPEEGSASGFSAAMRDRILTAALPVIERFTIAKFGMEDVARAAGIARQTVYRYFRNKDALLVGVYVRHIEQLHRDAMRETVERPPSADNLVAIFMAQLQAARSFPLFDQALDPRVAPYVAELTLSAPELISALEAVWLPILKRYSDADVLRTGLDFHATVRWITYQQFWFLTHPNALATDDKERGNYVMNFIIPALVRRILDLPPSG